MGRLRRRGLCIALPAACALALVSTGAFSGADGTSRAVALAPGEPVAQTDDSLPASNVTMIGATPLESGAPGSYETWGVGVGASGEPVVVHYAAGAGWSLGPALQDQSGAPLKGFAVDTPAAFTSHAGPSTLAGQLTEDGAGVLAGSLDEATRQVLLVREPNNPANPFRETKPVPEAEGYLEAGSRLFGLTRAPLIAPLDEAGGSAGAFVVPVKERQESPYREEHVLHWDGQKEEWSSEKIELPSAVIPSEFRVLAIGASSPTNAWLLAQVSSEGVALFKRQLVGGEAIWKAVKIGKEAGEPLAVPLEKAQEELLAVPGGEDERVQNQVLTVTGEGVWIDGERPHVKASTTLYFKPEGEGGKLTSWCTLENSPPNTAGCEYGLPVALPTGPSRSIAWANSTASFGERVITGLPDGVSLRLEGNAFNQVLGLGGAGSHDQGATYGAAFSNSREGWLGNYRLPVHLTTRPEANLLEPWPVSFRHALVAVAPQPGAPVASLSSEALAVGDLGEVARFKPGVGWLPESLFGPKGRETPRLRAVAWPTPDRAYAVGDAGVDEDETQMWLWRGETGLWEPDPATPYNFRGNLLGIAFDPENPDVGYAVGEGGVLLGYGKTWTQQALPAEAPCTPESEASNSAYAEESERCGSWANASFTSVAFAGAEAIVAYRILPDHTTERYQGGLIVNDGSGWHIDQSAHEAMGSNVPWAVSGLPDGGAAFGASRMVYEREASGQQWHATATPFPGGLEPGSLTAFRENGSMRVIATGSVPNTYEVEKEPEAPPGSPPTQIAPYPLAANPEAGVVRQTATGWSDQEHELNDAAEPEGNWSFYDEVYEPDPISAVLVSSSGSQGWAVGGFVEPEQHGGVLDTADVDRYGEPGVAPLGKATSPVEPANPSHALFAIGGNAQCAAPCATRARARIGPDVWLEGALQHADIAGVRGFFYTGPRLVDPQAVNGKKESADRISYGQELSRYTEILAGSPIPAFAVATPTDLDEAGSGAPFESSFAAQPFGGSATAQRSSFSLLGATAANYAYESTGSGGGSVRVVMLEDATETGQAAEVGWLEGMLAGAKSREEPAIVVGNADLNAQIAGHDEAAASVKRAIVAGNAAAYFFDAPEENIEEDLGGSVEAYGSGTLGYVKYQAEAGGAFLGASGFMLVEVGPLEHGRAAVNVQLIPNIGELALEGENGTLLHRSATALFSGLARRSRSGNRSASGAEPNPETSPYIPIPSICVGAACSTGLLPKYEFVSSNAEVGGFVKQNLAAEPKGHEPLFNAKGEPEREPTNSKGESVSTTSGLFCAYNPGSTTVKIHAGGLSASLPVTVQAGSVREPCGTVPLTNLPSKQTSAPVPAPAPTPTPTGAAPASAPPPVPVPPPPTVAVVPRPATHPNPPFLLPAAPTATVLAFVPLPVPTPARPTPPSGTSAVTSPVEAAEREEEREAAPESVSNEAVAYRANEHEPIPAYLLGIIVLAAFAGASVRRRPRSRRGKAQIAPATITSIRNQRQISTRRRQRW